MSGNDHNQIPLITLSVELHQAQGQGLPKLYYKEIITDSLYANSLKKENW